MFVPSGSRMLAMKPSTHEIVPRKLSTLSPTNPYRQGHDTAWVLQRCIYVFIAIAAFAVLCSVIWFYRRRERSRRTQGKPAVYDRGGRRWLKWHDQHGSSTAGVAPYQAPSIDQAAVNEHEGATFEKLRSTYQSSMRDREYEKDQNPNSLLNV